jgi:hypothetical protein
MINEIILEGKRYKLVPVEEEKVQPFSWKDQENNKDEVIEAQPKLSDYRERFKRRELRPSDVKTEPKFMAGPKELNQGELDQISNKLGEDVFFGSGTEDDF